MDDSDRGNDKGSEPEEILEFAPYPNHCHYRKGDVPHGITKDMISICVEKAMSEESLEEPYAISFGYKAPFGYDCAPRRYILKIHPPHE